MKSVSLFAIVLSLSTQSFAQAPSASFSDQIKAATTLVQLRDIEMMVNADRDVIRAYEKALADLESELQKAQDNEDTAAQLSAGSFGTTLGTAVAAITMDKSRALAKLSLTMISIAAAASNLYTAPNYAKKKAIAKKIKEQVKAAQKRLEQISKQNANWVEQLAQKRVTVNH